MNTSPESEPRKKQLPLSRMRAGQTGTVAEIQGGRGLGSRLDAMGIRPGKRITKIGGMLLHGAVTFQVDSTRLAIGYGMAAKILVEVDGPS